VNIATPGEERQRISCNYRW